MNAPTITAGTPLCLWCGHPLPTEYTEVFDDPSVLLPGCPACDMPDYSALNAEQYGRELTIQCAWCGYLFNGPDQGKKALTKDKEGRLTADLSAGETHTCCSSCLLVHFPRTALKRKNRVWLSNTPRNV